jgi:hypothetical protein
MAASANLPDLTGQGGTRAAGCASGTRRHGARPAPHPGVALRRMWRRSIIINTSLVRQKNL